MNSLKLGMWSNIRIIAFLLGLFALADVMMFLFTGRGAWSGLEDGASWRGGFLIVFHVVSLVILFFSCIDELWFPRATLIVAEAIKRKLIGE